LGVVRLFLGLGIGGSGASRRKSLLAAWKQLFVQLSGLLSGVLEVAVRVVLPPMSVWPSWLRFVCWLGSCCTFVVEGPFVSVVDEVAPLWLD